eukprot:scaffold4.g4574.t1
MSDFFGSMVSGGAAGGLPLDPELSSLASSLLAPMAGDDFAALLGASSSGAGGLADLFSSVMSAAPEKGPSPSPSAAAAPADGAQQPVASPPAPDMMQRTVTAAAAAASTTELMQQLHSVLKKASLTLFLYPHLDDLRSAFNLSVFLERDHELLEGAWRGLAEAEEQHCTPPRRIPSESIPSGCAGPDATLRIDGGWCAINHDKSVTCKRPSVSLARVPKRCFLHHSTPAAVVGKECKLVKLYGPEPSERLVKPPHVVSQLATALQSLSQELGDRLAAARDRLSAARAQWQARHSEHTCAIMATTVQAGTGASGHSSPAEVARRIVALGTERLGPAPEDGWQDADALADLLLSHGAAALAEKLRPHADRASASGGKADSEAGIDLSGLASLAADAEARKGEASASDPPQVVKEVRRLVRAEVGKGVSNEEAEAIMEAAEAQAAKRDPALRPTATDLASGRDRRCRPCQLDVHLQLSWGLTVGVLRAAEAELTSREAKQHGGTIPKDSLAARVQSAADHMDRLRAGGHHVEPALAAKVRAKLRARAKHGEEGPGTIPQGPAKPQGEREPASAAPPTYKQALREDRESRPISKQPPKQTFQSKNAKEA